MLSTKKMIVAIFLATVCWIPAQILAGFIGNALLPINEDLSLIVYVASYNGLTFLFLKLLSEKWLKQPLLELGIGRVRFLKKHLLLSILLPLAVIGLIVAFVPGQWMGIGSDFTAKFFLVETVIYVGLVGSIIEELIYRGFIYHLLRQRLAVFPSALISGSIFALAHVFNPGYTVLGFLLFVVFSTALGVLFAYMTEESGSIWGGALLHFIWNIVNVVLFNINSEEVATSFLNYVVEEHVFWFTGTETSGSLFTPSAFVLLVLACLFLSRSQSKQLTT